MKKQTNYIDRVNANLVKVKNEKELSWKDMGKHWKAIEKMVRGNTPNGVSLKVFCDTCTHLGVKPSDMLNKDM